MTKKTWMTLGILTALTGAPLLAGAQPGGGPGKWGKPSFEQLDTNKDGKVSPAEMQAEVTRHFTQFDANKDGKVTQQEVDAFMASKRAEHEAKHEEHAKQRFAEQDANKDGKLSKDEMARLPGDWFERLDLNGDKFITADEMKEAHAAMKERFGKHGGRGGKLFGKLDSNGNGSVDSAEVAAHAKERFDRLDADKNGALSKDELDARGCGGNGKGGHHGWGKHERGERGKSNQT